MLKSSKLLVVIAVLALAAGAAMAQPAAGAPVPLDTVGPPVGGEQGTTEVGNPAAGAYDILVNGYIGAYARVSVYDNWIDFGVMDPTMGTFDVPARRLAWVDGVGGGVLAAGEIGGRAPIYDVNTSTLDYDLAGIQIQTNARLDLQMDMGGYMTRVDDTGAAWLGTDNRRADAGPYQLRNQVKMVLHGRFLNYLDFDDPAADDDGVQFASPTSGQDTDFNTWTDWSAAGNAINNEDGWFEPTEIGVWSNDPWGGEANLLTDGGRQQFQFINLVVERGQAQDSGLAAAAEVWFTQRVLRRGLQDVQGNYRSDMMVELTYREGDVDDRWLPGVKP